MHGVQSIWLIFPAGALAVLWLLAPPSHDLKHALRLSSGFLHAQRCTAAPLGALPDGVLTNNGGAGGSFGALAAALSGAPADTLARFPWLSSVPTCSSTDVVSGGFFMAGDYVKHTAPLAASMSLLAWAAGADIFAGGIDKVCAGVCN